MYGKKRIFVSFAYDDAYARDFLVGQARNKNSPFEFIDMSVKEAFDTSWKTRCRSKIRGCNGMIALISPKTIHSKGARWEMWCANDENIPLLGVYISKDRPGQRPLELAGKQVIYWSWNGIANFIRSL